MFLKLKQNTDKLFNYFKNFKNKPNYYEILKIIYLGCAFFFILGTYSVLRPFKASVFLGFVGKEYLPTAKLISMFILFPCLFLYSKLVDKLRRYQVVYFCLILYAVIITLFAFILTHPVIGLHNTQTTPYRILGWIFYFFIDLYMPFIVSTFWAFANSISTPENAKKSYGKIVAISRLGGLTSTLISLLIMEKTKIPYTISIPFIMVGAAAFLIFSCFAISRLMKKIPGYLLHGYQAAYEAEKKQKEKNKTGLLAGLKMIITQPYVLGIFGLVYSYEAISIILDYQLQVLMSIEKGNAVGAMSSFMLKYTASFQAVALFFAFFGTSRLLKKIGVSSCILIMPLAVVILTFGLLTYPSLSTIFVIMVLLRALNYGFNSPVREILYIPTTKDIKFKSKSWIESFGRSLSKTSGSALNQVLIAQKSLNFVKIDSVFTLSIAGIWTLIAILVGKKYNKTIEKNEVIGLD